ncbi:MULTISPECIES: GNAT family N-acetyltransferase [Stutzerimonas stutzeri group]|uniref:GNAT family N-acetyltransferase n=1 Tax=Stutzerimonas stutzeri group TaxID=136846 RepID=UPI0008390311|nr:MULTISPECIES: GNAT family N-acetyltransferase [Stutzerimonas stutzeri group]MBK3758561.1 GNAT family N-acetyltransferase [Stutzerimonas frequens]MBK3871027.1 GNAT family N-acetyltransferase [Stutzerimonas frequens]MBK3909364.1 GNAT family N-acetyltransferase [Stutzerimonas frequens]MBK3929062.1 GNAT family N-acetyltransferase [Stutzerimonas frequens]MBO0644141.1 N-acetyltransferase [Stutzerimonas stutzeri]
MPIQTLHRLAELDPTEWDALLADSQPFLRHAFLSSLEDSGSVGGRSGWQPAHRLLRDPQGGLRAALPLYRKSHSYGEYVFDWAWADACQRAGIRYYPKLLCAVPFTPVAGQRLLGDVEAAATLLDGLTEQLDAQQMSGIHVNFTESKGDRLMAGREGWLERIGCQFHWHNRGYRDFQDFLDALTSRKRKQLRKEREHVAGQGIVFDWREGHQLSEAEWDFVYACYANTYQVRGQAPYLSRAFFSLLAERMPQAIRVVLAQQSTRPVAMAFSLRDDSGLYGRYWGCLAEFDRLHFETCFYQGIDQAIADGLQRFDAGAQGEHKLIRGFEPVITRSWHYLQHPGLRAAVTDFLQQERVGVLAYAEAARQALPYRQAGS